MYVPGKNKEYEAEQEHGTIINKQSSHKKLHVRYTHAYCCISKIWNYSISGAGGGPET